MVPWLTCTIIELGKKISAMFLKIFFWLMILCQQILHFQVDPKNIHKVIENVAKVANLHKFVINELPKNMRHPSVSVV